MKFCPFTFLLTILLATDAVADSKSARVLEYPTPMVREEQQVMVAGQEETWQLKWESTPNPFCEAADDGSLTCPCTGFAFGEGGKLAIIRIRNGVEIDRMDLTQFFEGQGRDTVQVAIIQRWPTDSEKDFDAVHIPDFPSRVSKRKVVQIMHFADYDHDGLKTEFYLQTEAWPCGKSAGVVIGISKLKGRIHAFGTVTRPNPPLYMLKNEWEALRRASGPIEVLDWACGDHAAETETRLPLRWTEAGIDGTNREFNCPSEGEKRQLIRERPLGDRTE